MKLATLPTTSAVFQEFQKLIEEDPEATSLEIVAEIECDDEDLAHQREQEIETPIASLHLIAQWHPAAKGGILDWFYLTESALAQIGPDSDEAALADLLQHGGSLFGFRYEGDEPEFEALLEPATTALNEAVPWADFALDEEE